MVDRLKPAWVEFGKHVRRLRTQGNLSLDRLSRMTSYSATYHSKIERAVRVPNAGIVEALDREFGTNGALIRMWRDVERSENGKVWYYDPDDYVREGTEMRYFHPFVLPGFLQVEEYARVIASHASTTLDREHVQRVVSGRTQWRERLRENTDLVVSVVIPEFVLTRLVGGAEVMRGQLERLAAEAREEAVTVQVLPSGIRDFAWTAGAFWLVYFSDQSPLVVSEHSSGEHVTDEESVVRRLEATYSRLQVWALSPDASLQRIEEVREEL
ncbi:Scr1 family TA system antitoxin-like transcriptional regulator [Nocardiopsis sp. CNT312]|uniref:Scr1 family TA system antitoxin-like transcriptional regulator n=1 Tax=Nocardiopsis sp. CNT312 TaxID=1137268 RepID=UPI00048C3DC3|nr:Scr1 family TA system antitoxin-like transcriptional regulator [Nocardiopsis sp. CNT312]